jgi:hypothetical protein
VLPFRKRRSPAERPEGRRPTRGPAWPALVFVLLHVGLRQLFDPWLNSQSNVKVWVGGGLVLLPLVFAVIAVARAFRWIPPNSPRLPQYPPKKENHREEPPPWP